MRRPWSAGSSMVANLISGSSSNHESHQKSTFDPFCTSQRSPLLNHVLAYTKLLHTYEVFLTGRFRLIALQPPYLAAKTLLLMASVCATNFHSSLASNATFAFFSSVTAKPPCSLDLQILCHATACSARFSLVEPKKKARDSFSKCDTVAGCILMDCIV